LHSFLGKSKTSKTIAKTALIPALFNINEPILFGLPVAFNPVMMIPTWLNVAIATEIGGWLAKLNIIGRGVVYAHWATPIFFRGMISAGMDISTGIAEVLLSFIMPMFIYYPFFRVWDKVLLKQEIGEGEGEQ